MKLEELFSRQAACFAEFGEFEDELKTMRILQTVPAETQEFRRKLYLEWLNSLEKPIKAKQSTEESRRLREEGNKAFNAKPRQPEDLLNASQFYTHAIFTAPPPPPVPDGKSEMLALAYANRAMALQEYGYYRQAYDDCECALEYGYPEQMVHKVVTRQAHCALQLKDMPRLKRHLDTLEDLQLNANFKVELAKLRSGWEKLIVEGSQESKVEPFFDYDTAMNPHRETQKIVESPGPRGRYMVATQAIKENDLIFAERSPAFVPVGDNLVCQQCCALLLIPYPCAFCNLQVVYCSLRCRTLHATIHAHECAANQRDLFSQVGIAHLALRTMISGLPQVAPLVAQLQSAEEIWNELNGKSGSSLLALFPMEYKQSLAMVSHLGSMAKDDILWFALVAELLVIYLQEFTVFFDNFKQLAANSTDWELVAASLLLRHIGQLIVNAHTSVSLVPQRTGLPYDPLYLPLLDATIWSSPHHVKRGCLHKFSDYEETAAINFPYLSVCNHSCEPSLQPRFSGAFVYTYAAKDLAADAEIFNCYTLDYKKSKRANRQAALQGVYKFECKCEKCERSAPDVDYQQFHRYRCEHAACRQVFVPDQPELSTLNWWDSVDGLPPGQYIKCTVCGEPQHCKWFTEFNELLKTDAVATARQALFKQYEQLSEWLLDFHELRLMSAFQLVSDCFAAHNGGSPLTDDEFTTLAEILKFYLAGIAAQSRQNSIEYVVKLTFLWDFMALGKYKASKAEMDEMLKSVEIVSHEFRRIFLHYYEDYLKSGVEEE